MNTMYRCAVAALVAACIVAPAAAQTRSFPPNALRGTLVVADDGQILLNGRVGSLSPGSRLRNEQNMIVLPASVIGSKRLVHYTLDIGNGQVRDVWLLRPEEAAIRPWPVTLEQAHTWTFDPTTMSWTKP
jgi:hypothetical protein